MTRRVVFTAVVSALALASGALYAQAPAGDQPMVDVEPVRCIPEEYNGLVEATVSPDLGGRAVRLYFRWDEHGAYYFTDMVADGAGKYWGLTARPEPRNETVEYYVEVADLAVDRLQYPLGKELNRSALGTAPVQEDCEQDLTPWQVGAANNLTVGETVVDQEGGDILGFLCDGVVTRINYLGIMRPDEICRGCVIPWWLKEEYMGAAAFGLGAATIITVDQEDPSPTRPQP